VRQKLVETGDVDVMIAIRSNFFYTRTVPCELWFLNRQARSAPRQGADDRRPQHLPQGHAQDLRLFRPPEQEQNLLAIVWLYRGETEPAPSPSSN
jgi:type I restriction enzyme M protein